MENDWITNFFDNCRLISDEEMQSLWAKLLAGEANSPGRYSKRTVNVLSSMDKSDAVAFKSLCSFCWTEDEVFPLIYDSDHPIYLEGGLTFRVLKHLDSIGVLSIDKLAGFKVQGLPKTLVMKYHTHLVQIEFPKPNDNDLSVGQVLLSKVGRDLVSICDSDDPYPGFMDYVVALWRSYGLTVTPMS